MMFLIGSLFFFFIYFDPGSSTIWYWSCNDTTIIPSKVSWSGAAKVQNRGEEASNASPRCYTSSLERL
jgi:hypothetical protein